MNKITHKITGTITYIGDTITIDRSSKNIPNLDKKIIKIETQDGQVLFPELRNKKIPLFESMYLREGDLVDIEVSFQGSEKNGKRYNNIFINEIKPKNHAV